MIWLMSQPTCLTTNFPSGQAAAFNCSGPAGAKPKGFLFIWTALGNPAKAGDSFNQLGFFGDTCRHLGWNQPPPNSTKKSFLWRQTVRILETTQILFEEMMEKILLIEKNNWKRPTDFLRITSLQHRHPAAHGLWGKVSHLFADSDLNQKSKRNFLYLFTLTDGPCLNKTLLYSKMRTIV